MGRRLTHEEKIERAQRKYLIKQIRKSKPYLRWKRKILERDVKSYPNIPKGVQVHHKIEISKLIERYKIKTVEDAINCEEFWYTDIGISLKRGEHFIFTKLGRYKYLTKGFRALLEDWLNDCQTDYLDCEKKRRKK